VPRSSIGPSRTAINEGDRQLRRTATRFGDELRELRLRSGISQAQTARAVGVARSVICRLEQGDPNASNRIRARVAAALGADFRIAIYPQGSPVIYDRAHARLVEAILRRTHPSWHAIVEAPIPGPGRRSSDLRLARGDDIVLIEVETRIRAFETILRELADKRSGVEAAMQPARVHVVLAIPPTRHHRALVGAHPRIVASAFPAPAADLAGALGSSFGPWPGDGILWLATAA